MEKLAVAVMFGGLSAEHDVSILTGLQALEALDPTRFDAYPVYVDLNGQWWVGEALRERKNYLPDLALKRQLTRVCWPVGAARREGRWHFVAADKPFLGQPKTFAVDVVVPAFHGCWGEDGMLQGVLQAEGVPMACGSVGPMAIAMDKMACQQVASGAGLPTVPSVRVARGEEPDVQGMVKRLGGYPLIVKPNFLGSSIGVHKVSTSEGLLQALTDVLRLDTAALVQRCIPNLVEYNVAVRRGVKGEIVTSAIERPKRGGDTLDFKDKYLSAGTLNKLGQKIGGPTQGTASEGMASADRTLNPPEFAKGEGAKVAKRIRDYATTLFVTLDLAGTPRLDFMMDGETGELWFNEINPIPGSLAYFLWEEAETEARTGFTGLLSQMIDEARGRLRSHHRQIDPVATGGCIFPKRG